MKKTLVAIALLASPLFAYAQGAEQVIGQFGKLINLLLPLIVALAVLGFFWGLALYVFKAGEEDTQKKARQMMIWGILIIFVMVSLWGFIKILQGTFGNTLGDTTNPVNIPGGYQPAGSKPFDTYGAF